MTARRLLFVALILGNACSAEVTVEDAPAADGGTDGLDAAPPGLDAAHPGLDAGGARPDAGGADDAGVAVGTCPAWPAPTGTVVRVTPSQADELPSLVANAETGTTILLADGTYRSSRSGEAARRINLRVPGVTLRSESNDASRVVIDGEYETGEILAGQASNVVVAHLTVTRAYYHPIHVSPPAGTNNIEGVVLYGLRLTEGSEQFVKVNSNGAGYWADDGRIECSSFTMTDAGRPHVRNNCYTGGIDVHGGRGWQVRHNRFEGIWCSQGLAEHAIHFWNGARDTRVENNLIVDCARGIGFGLGESTASPRVWPDPPVAGYLGHLGGTIRNNVIWASVDAFDTGIGLEQAYGARVVHNTIASADGVAGFFSSIDYRFANTAGGEIRNNLTRRITQRTGATATADHNLENTPLTYFRDAAGLDFHLASGATNAINRGATLLDSGVDLDGEAHSNGAPDLGADERCPLGRADSCSARERAGRRSRSGSLGSRPCTLARSSPMFPGGFQMHATKESLPTERSGSYERHAAQAGAMTAQFERVPKDFPPGGDDIYQGLPEQACQCPHWGYVFSGRLEFRYTDGTREVFGPGEAYYARPGHRWRCLEEAETVEFSPADELEANSGRILQNLRDLSALDAT